MRIGSTTSALDPISGQAPSGAAVRGYRIAPDRVEIGAATRHTLKHPRLAAAVNATFFTANGSVGDLKGPGLLELDQGPRDQASDKRHFLAFTDKGPLEGTGGYEEFTQTQPAHTIDGFIGGLGQLFDAKQQPALERDIRSGTFQKRLDQAIREGRFPNISIRESAARTLIGVTAERKLVVLTVGQGQKRGWGATLAEAAKILKQHGAVSGYCLDGGGSTHWWQETRTDGRQVASYLGFFTCAP